MEAAQLFVIVITATVTGFTLGACTLFAIHKRACKGELQKTMQQALKKYHFLQKEEFNAAIFQLNALFEQAHILTGEPDRRSKN
jgi:hypothetical protein